MEDAARPREAGALHTEPCLQVSGLGRLSWAEEPPGSGTGHEDIARWLEGLYKRQRDSLKEHTPPQGSNIFFFTDPSSRKPPWHALFDPNKQQPSLCAQIPRAAFTDWSPIEAALLVHSVGQFHPLRDRRDDVEGVEAVPEVFTSGDAIDTGRILASVICPTTSERQAYHPLLYECFRRQTHERRELIVIDTGSEPSKFFLERAAEDPRVVYRFFESPPKAWPLGLKRNIACYLAKGHVIAHFDDDDLYSPGYLTFMLTRIVQKKSKALWKDAVPAVVAKLSAWHILDAETRTWGFLDAKADPEVQEMRHSWLFGWGFSYVYTRTTWEIEPFPEVTFAEDYSWINKVLDRRITVVLARDQAMQTEGVACHTYHPSTSTSGGEFNEECRVGFLVQGAPPALADLMPTFDRVVPELPGKQPSNKYEAILRQDFADRVGLQEKSRNGGRLLRYRWDRFSSRTRW